MVSTLFAHDYVRECQATDCVIHRGYRYRECAFTRCASTASEQRRSLESAEVCHLNPIVTVAIADNVTYRSRALNPAYTRVSVLGLNAVLLESPTVLQESTFADDTAHIIVNGIGHKTVSPPSVRYST